VIQGVIFDLGSTLVRFTGNWPRVFAHSLDVLVEGLECEGLSFDHGRFKRTFKMSLEEYHQRRDRDLIERTTGVVLTETLTAVIGKAPPEPAVKRALEKMYRVSQKYWQTLPATHQVLENLKSRGLRLGLISNASDEADVQRLIDKAGIRKHLDPILISAGFGLRKPHPDIFKAVLREWQLPAESVVMVGDLLEADIAGAENVGMRHIWMTEEIDHQQIQQPYLVDPDAIAEQLIDVPVILDQLNLKGSQP
jgi:HAD superfamily hydrolase (TIGR01549 family)